MGPENETKCIYRLQGAYVKSIGKNVLKINILSLELGKILKKKVQKTVQVKGPKYNAICSSIFVHFGYPFGVSFGPKMVQKRCPKPSAKMSVSSSVLGGVTPLLAGSRTAPTRPLPDPEPP